MCTESEVKRVFMCLLSECFFIESYGDLGVLF